LPLTRTFTVGVGFYRGALGTVLGFAEIGAIIDNDDDRDIPIVLVQMDEHYDGPSCLRHTPRVVPFHEKPSREAIKTATSATNCRYFRPTHAQYIVRRA